jgi:hypothetical protein
MVHLEDRFPYTTVLDRNESARLRTFPSSSTRYHIRSPLVIILITEYLWAQLSLTYSLYPQAFEFSYKSHGAYNVRVHFVEWGFIGILPAMAHGKPPQTSAFKAPENLLL